MPFIELGLLVAALVALVVLAQRSRLKSSDYDVLQAVGARRGLALERGQGTAALAGQVAGRTVRVHAILGGWAVTVEGVDDPDAARAALPEATIGAGRLQLLVPLEVDAIDVAITRGIAACEKNDSPR